MTIYHNRDVQLLTEIVEDNGCGSCIGCSVSAGHRSGLIQQKCNRKLRYIVRESILIEHLAVISAQSVRVQTAAHNEAGLLSASLRVFQFLFDAFLQFLGDSKQGSGDFLILGFQVPVNIRDPMNLNGNTGMNISIGNGNPSAIMMADTYR